MGKRIEIIDLARGLVIVLMALDHSRDFFGPALTSPTDIETTTPGWFFTRWITHLCAPVFVYLAGVSARLYLEKTGEPAKLSRFLIVRGLWLILLEFVVINFSWKFNYANFLFVQVIWLLGLAMIWLALTHYLPRALQWIIALAMIAGHGLLYPYDQALVEAMPWAWSIIHVQNWLPIGEDFGVVVVYPLVPWFGVISAGFLTADVFRKQDSERDRALFLSGGAMILLFVILRALNGYGDPDPWTTSDRGAVYTLLSFLNVEKYPPSLTFLLVTLGISFACMPLLDKLRRLPRRIILVFGSVSLFFYLVHIPIIHVLAVIRNHLQFGENVEIYAKNTWPEAYEPNLFAVYAGWFAALFVSYVVSLWYFRYKSTHSQWWLKYL